MHLKPMVTVSYTPPSAHYYCDCSSIPLPLAEVDSKFIRLAALHEELVQNHSSRWLSQPELTIERRPCPFPWFPMSVK